jgi:hypothetical protein
MAKYVKQAPKLDQKEYHFPVAGHQRKSQVKARVCGVMVRPFAVRYPPPVGGFGARVAVPSAGQGCKEQGP